MTMLRIEHLPADIFGLSELSRAAIRGDLESLGIRVPRHAGQISAGDDRLDPEQRAELSERLVRELSYHSPHVAVLDSARALAHARCFAIVTGQQPGFTTSPLYTLYKALSAIRLARVLSQRLETRVVPIFWNHADDHDIAEAHHTHIVNANLDLQKVALPGLSSGRTPLSHVVLEEDKARLSALRAVFEQSLRGAPHLESALQACFPRSGETLASATTRSLLTLLGEHGLIVIEPAWIRPELSRALAQLIQRSPERAIAAQSARLAAAGHAVALEPEHAALLFHHEQRGAQPQRRALRAAEDGYRYDGEEGSRTADELAAEILQEPLAWSAGALLRPVVQDMVLPTLVYVGGFGELAYHAQLPLLRAEAGLGPVQFAPRLSATLTDPALRTALEILQTTTGTVLARKGDLSAPGETADPQLSIDLRELAKAQAQALLAHREELQAVEPSLVVQLKKISGQSEDLVTTLADKAARAHHNRSGKGRRHERRAANVLMPRGLPQERVLGPLPWIARYGTEWIHELAREHDPLAMEHLVIHLGADEVSGEQEDDGE